MSYLCFTESKLPTKARNKMDDSQFGIPEQRRYPLHDKAHVLAAIRMFNHVDKEHEAELAKNIIRKMEEYNIPKDSVGQGNRLYNYINEGGGSNE
jgi:hypothetical protein